MRRYLNPQSRALGHQQAIELLEIGRGLVADFDVESVLQRVLEAARDLTGARYAALGVLDSEQRELERFLFVGIDDETRAAIGSFPRGRGVLGELIRNPRPLRLERVGDHPRSYGFPPEHPPMNSFLGVPISIRGRVFGNLYLTEKAGGAQFNEVDEHTLIVLAEWAAVAINNARLYQDEQERRIEFQRATRSFEASAAIARALGGETHLDVVLDLVSKRGRALIDATWALILVLEGEELVVRAAAGELSEDPIGSRLPIETSLSGQALAKRDTQMVADVQSHILAGSQNLAADLGATTAIYVPLFFRARPVGVLMAADKLTGEGFFGEEDKRLLEGFAGSAASAVATAQTVEAERLRESIGAAERERARWARELHDETLQELAALRVLLDGARKTGRAQAYEEALATAGDELERTIGRLHSVITDLRPAELDQLGLASALESLTERAAHAGELGVLLDLDLAWENRRASTRLTDELESAIYRLVQEALNNVVKHAEAGSVEVKVSEDDSVVEVSVIDSGRGFEQNGSSGGFGLIGMRERVQLLGGSLSIDSTLGEGTTVRATIPAAHLSEQDPDPELSRG
jgi:signal transduction histidine kinase